MKTTQFRRWAADAAKRRAIDLLALTTTPLALRLSLGRWPSPLETDQFRAAFRDQTSGLPALVRGLTAVDGVAPLFIHALRLNAEPATVALSPISGNVLTAWTGPKLGFLHLEKCGGVAVMRWLAPQFHPDQIDPDPFRAAPPHQYYRSPPGLAGNVARYPLLWGHFGLPALERIDPGRFIFTILREPRARLISIYHFWRSVRPEMVDDIDHDPIVGSAHRHDLLGFLRDPEPMLRDYLDNFYVRRLTGCYITGSETDRLAEQPERCVAAARAALDRIGFVGLTERMDESVQRLAARIGAEPPVESVRGNVTAENHIESQHFFRPAERSVITPAIEAELDRLTRLDREIYACAVRRFDHADHPAELVFA
ncbi:hypothetical protein [Acidiphilium sp.]|uniref:hypothetical protein n=1 Tax=Acidiphilium sp. TaxID=527 RepID=UPI003D07DF59